MKYLILFFLSISSGSLYAQCCDFDIEHNIEVQGVPTLDELESCLNDKSCDTRHYYLGKIIHAIRASDLEIVDQNFENIITIIENKSSYDKLDYRVINFYANHLRARGEETQARAYYHFINNKVEETSPLKLISSLNINGINNNSDGVVKDISKLNALPENDISIDGKLLNILRAASYLNTDKSYELLKQHRATYKSSKREDIIFLYLITLHRSFINHQDPFSNDVWSRIEESNYSPLSSHFAHKWVIEQSTKLTYDGEYEKALSTSKNYLESLLDNFNNNKDLLSHPSLLEKVFPETLTNYAQNSLFQTRLGKGTPPVIDAFEIFEFVYLNRLKKRIKHLYTITSDSDITTTLTPNAILIIGTYLYQETQDIQYLNRAYTVVNGMSSGGISYWANARALMRENISFKDDILKKNRLVSEATNINKDNTLQEIFNQQKALKKYKESTENKHQEFHSSILKSYEVDLKSLQDQMKRDSAACLDYFLDAHILYRLYISPDTIDISILNKNSGRTLELTEQLAMMVENGKSAKAMEAASRELYDLLFEGIKDDLPPRLHIIANSKLLDIPFSVLRKDTLGEAPSYLGVEHAISRQFSLSTMRLLEETELNASYAQPLAMAPSFANEFLQASELRQAGFQLPPLVYNTEELNDLQSRSGGKYLYDDDATIESYRDKVSDYNIIHLATHAISSEVDGLRSRVYLLDKGGEPVGLYAEDIGNQTLNSELVVLSACETGGGGVHYVEGRVGLTKAYLAAGARSVVSSNWAVDDHATAEQMKTFYDGIEAGQPPHVALQGARRAYVEAHPDAAPYKWAAFEAYGGMGPVRWNKDAGRGNWWWLALPVLGLGAVVVWNKKQRASRGA